MSIFRMRVVKENATNIDGYQGWVHEDPSYLDKAVMESARDSYKIQAGLYVADAMMEEAVVMEGATYETVLEGFGTGVLGKVKEMFKKLIAKIKGWYEAFLKNLRMMFKSGDEFVKEFAKELGSKTAKGYKYKSFKYDFGKGDSEVNKFRDGLSKNVDQYKKVFEANDFSRMLDGVKGAGSVFDEYNIPEQNEKILANLGADSVSEMEQEIMEAYRSGATEKEQLEDFEGNSKSAMMDLIKNNAKTLSTIEKDLELIEREGNNIVKALDKAESNMKNLATGEQGTVATVVSQVSEKVRFAYSGITSAVKCRAVIRKEAAREFETVLKGFLRFKPVKEGFSTIEHDGQVSSVLESAMRFV